jgi:uncharacterized protein YciI
MIFAVIGLFKQPVPARDSGFEAALNEHFSQPSLRIVNAGYLRDAQGEPVGLLGLIESESFAKVEAFLQASPFHRGGYYERVQIAAYDIEVGRLD